MVGECIKCNGRGFFNIFGHICNGRCFNCGGTGKCEVKMSESKPAPVTTRKWSFDAFTVTELNGRFEVVSKTGASVYVWADGFAMACDSVKGNKAQAEAWASQVVLGLLAA